MFLEIEFILKIKVTYICLLFIELSLNIKQNTAKNSSILILKIYNEKVIKKENSELADQKNE